MAEPNDKPIGTITPGVVDIPVHPTTRSKGEGDVPRQAKSGQPKNTSSGDKIPPPARGSETDDFGPFRALGELTIEFAESQNRKILFAPTNQSLRGRWSKANLLGVTMNPILQQMPDLPGMCIHLDFRRRTARVFDPLTLPENAELLRIAHKVYKEGWKIDGGPEKESTKDKMSTTEMKTWLYWIRRSFDNSQCRVITGTMPDMDTIMNLPGKTARECYNQSSRVIKYREDWDAAEQNRLGRVMGGYYEEDEPS